MNSNVRQAVRLELSKRNMSQSQLAAEVGVSRQYLSNIMRGVSGNVPTVWDKVFNALELELVVRSKHGVSPTTFKQPIDTTRDRLPDS